MVGPMSKRRWIVGVAGIWLAWHMLGGPSPTAPGKPPALQIAVLKDGFAIAEAVNDRHLIELERDGNQRKRWAIPLLGDMRIVGSTVGSTLAWIDTKDKVLRLAPLKSDGQLGASTAFGRNAAQLCNGAASTTSGFSVAWRAGDGGIWFVRGPLDRSEVMGVDSAKVSDTSAPMTCSVRSAGEDVALFWRSGRHMEFDFCASTGCQGLRARVPLADGEQVADIACQSNGCAAALRSSKGVRLVAFDLRGKMRWQTALSPVPDQDVHLLAAGPRAYVVAYRAPDRNEVDRVLATTGSKELVGHSDERLSVPVISVAHGRLAYAWIDRDKVETYVRYFD
ncbi:hypothetical protein BH11MYX1_BH11MYX1_50030 [soil metagenome]